jgi:SAM-dependent methyltransferase
MKEFETRWRERFERFGREHEDDHLVSGWSETGLKRRLAAFGRILAKERIEAPARVLDVGCGAGTYVRFLTGLHHEVFGLDYSLPSLSRAVAADPRQACCYASGEAYRLPFRDGSFDLVVLIGVLQTLEDPGRAVGEMARVVRPGGLIVFEVLNAVEVVALLKSARDRLRASPPRLRTYSPGETRRWLSVAGLAPVRRVGIYLPPRRLPGLGRTLMRDGVMRGVDRIPGVSTLLAHAFLVVAKRPESSSLAEPPRARDTR